MKAEYHVKHNKIHYDQSIMSRVYLDWNATAPLRLEVRAAIINAMDVTGNPSSVHGEGRVAKGLVERARLQLAESFGCDPNGIIWTSSATEAAGLMMQSNNLNCAKIEHDCVKAYGATDLLINANGIVKGAGNFALQGANSETGICQGDQVRGAIMSDQVQTFGKLPISFNWLGIKSALLSAHKIGGPKGVGALVLSDGIDVSTQIKGGGQEQGRRSGTENLLGIVGFGVAAKVAAQDLTNGVWEQVAELRDKMEIRIADTANNAIFFGKDVDRLPNTSNFAVPGWKGDTQVMKMDLSGFAISAGSACSSGKVKVSQVLKAMGYDDITASSAIRVSIGPTTTEQEVMSFADAWIKAYKKFVAKAA